MQHHQQHVNISIFKSEMRDTLMSCHFSLQTVCIVGSHHLAELLWMCCEAFVTMVFISHILLGDND